jgi:hypothetical protein
MIGRDYTLAFTTDRSPQEVFDAITDVRAWWEGDITGPTADVGDVFTYAHPPQHRSVQRVAEARRGERIVWHVDDAELAFAADPGEWIGSDIVFDLAPSDAGTGTRVEFTHRGLVPTVECYQACSSAWAYYVGDSLRSALDG